MGLILADALFQTVTLVRSMTPEVKKVIPAILL